MQKRKNRKRNATSLGATSPCARKAETILFHNPATHNLFDVFAKEHVPGCSSFGRPSGTRRFGGSGRKARGSLAELSTIH